MTLKASKLDRLPQITQTLDAELREATPAFQEHYQRLHVGLREWWREYINIINARDRTDTQNLLINGGFQVWQRGTSFVSGFAGAVVYGPDRWSFWRDSAAVGVTVGRQTGTDPARYCVRVQRDSGNALTNNINFAQALTTENTIPLRAKAIGIRFKARGGADFSGSATAALDVKILTGTGTDQHPSGYTGSATAYSTPVTLTTAWQTFVVWNDAPIDASVTELAVMFGFTPFDTAGTNDYFELAEVQVVATVGVNVDMPWHQWRSFEEELVACETYYEKSFPYATAPAQNAGTTGAYYWSQVAGASTSQNGPALVPFRALKRSSPTLTLYNPSAANAQIRNTITGTDYTLSTSAVTQVNGWLPQGTSPGGSGAGNACAVHWTAESEL